VWLAPSFLFSSACTAQRALLTRAMRFRALATIDLVVLAVSGSVCITGAVAGLEVTSIVLQMLTLNVLTAALLWLASDWRPRFELDRAAVRELLPFSGNLTAFTALNYVVRKGDNLLIGRFLGPAQLGLYARGYSTLLYPTRQISSVLGNVMFSSLAKVSDDAERMRRVYLRAVGVIALVTFPLMSGLALVADRFVPAVLGPNWVEAVPLVRLFALLGITESLFTTVGWIYRATGRTDVLLRMGMVVGIAPLAGIVIGLQFGTVQAVAIGYGISTTLLMYPVVRIGGSMIGMPVRDLVRTVKPVALCAAAMATVVLAVRAVLPPMNDLAAVMLLASAGAGTYIGLVHLLRIGPYVDLREQVRTHLRPRRRVTA
jgi:O-antigen/teichoic acid export membrane protein